MIILLIYILLTYDNYYNNGVILIIKKHTQRSVTQKHRGSFQTSELMESSSPVTFHRKPIQCTVYWEVHKPARNCGNETEITGSIIHSHNA